ncbi:variable large family protein, partial [Borreliella garinii]|uniref:variable large family protein n=1 Tax=Borreliella garinii TaxID=29519 RepID=UPI001AED4A0A
RGLAKGGKFAAANNDGGKAASVKGVVESAVQKTFTALNEIVKKSVETGLKKVADAVKKEGGKTPEASVGTAAAK